jgi:hypothetical protein
MKSIEFIFAKKYSQDDTDTTDYGAEYSGAWKLARQPERLHALCRVVKTSFIASEKEHEAQKSHDCVKEVFSILSNIQLHLLLSVNSISNSIVFSHPSGEATLYSSDLCFFPSSDLSRLALSYMPSAVCVLLITSRSQYHEVEAIAVRGSSLSISCSAPVLYNIRLIFFIFFSGPLATIDATPSPFDPIETHLSAETRYVVEYQRCRVDRGY